MKRLVIALGLAAAAGCAGQDWNADDKRVGYTKGTDAGAMTYHRDPVTGKSVAADSPWKAMHEGRTFYFADQASMDEFKKNPAKYAKGTQP
jgi:YHS domain-containing protein